ncbi:MAG: type II toxin-antitoxin system VapC family toxin [Chloroflexi bacterium]|nr:type II toxin-antitoxin system VapC family toxin [Chloroflexota bacterium]
MVIGADTGFFLKRGERQARALEIWSSILSGEDFLVVSVLTVAEFYAHQIQRAKLAAAEELISQMQRVANISIVPVSLEIAAASARYRRGMNLPTVDAVIFATFLSMGCDVLVTTDSVFNQESVQNLIPVELLA